MIPRPLQEIYQRALRRPSGGYPGSYLFRPTPFTCPKCSAPVFVRIRHGSPTPIGATCGTCQWQTTYNQLPDLPDLPVQGNLEL